MSGIKQDSIPKWFFMYKLVPSNEFIKLIVVTVLLFTGGMAGGGGRLSNTSIEGTETLFRKSTNKRGEQFIKGKQGSSWRFIVGHGVAKTHH